MSVTKQDTKWITTGEAIRLLGFCLSPHTFRDKYAGLIPWVRTPGGHYRWLRTAVDGEAARMPQAV